MHVYTTGQWVLLFFFYCFCGWVWECCYVSLCQRRWVNRGFLHGPLLPIYGSGAIIILLATIPVAEDLRLVWLFGMIAATALEYVTGAVMERIFKVRYWDYSNQKFNLNGHICLTSSIAWGFFSILLVRFIHPPIARLLARVPALCVDPLAHVLVAAFTVDAVRSVQAALDLRDLLAKAAEENEDLRRLARRAEVYAAFAKDDLRRFREKTELDALELRQKVEEELAERRQAGRTGWRRLCAAASAPSWKSSLRSPMPWKPAGTTWRTCRTPRRRTWPSAGRTWKRPSAGSGTGRPLCEAAPPPPTTAPSGFSGPIPPPAPGSSAASWRR